MKRIFCDVCGDEFHYTDKAVKQTNAQQTLLFNTTFCNKPVVVSARIVMEAKMRTAKESIRSNFPGRSYSSQALAQSFDYEHTHADICGKCRWIALDQLRAGLPLLTDGYDGTIDWEGTSELGEPDAD